MAEIILAPTAQSKVIPLPIRLNDTDASLVSQLVTNRQFSTADTDAWFSFTLEGLAATTGTFDLTLINLHDKSVFNHTGKVFNTNPFYYKLDSGTDELTNEIRHAGKWVGQLVVTLANGDSATRKFIFGIEGHILDGTVVQTILLEDYNALIASIESAKDELTQYNIEYASLIGTVTEQEAARLEAEELRTIADALRETKEGIRQATFEANEVIRDGVVDSAIEGEMIAQTVETKLTEKEATYAPRLVSVEQQLADTLNKSAITLTHMFADNTARDVYFVANPTELMEQLFIKVGTAYQQYIEGVWTGSVPIVSEQLSATNQPIVDTGNYFATDKTNDALQELGAHKASTSNPHGVTKAQVGLGSVDNTSDANKPVSTAGQTALNLKADKTTTDGHATRITALESKAVKQYGVRRTLNASSTLLERLNDGVGLVANVPTDDGTAQNDFDAVYPFNQIKECIIDATGRIHYKGDPTYATAIGDWMVEVPLYYVKDVRTATTQDEYFSAFKLDGYRIPKDFIREDGTVCQKVYYGRFKTGKYGTTDVSRPGLVPSNYRDLASFRTGARAKGAGWQEVGINYVKDFLHKLTKVEFANLNSQTVFGPGITGARYTATDTAVIAGTAVNRFVTTIAIASNFNVGNVINIGTTLGGNNVASMRVITAINALDASNSEIVFDGAAVNIAIGNIIAMVAQKTGQTANLQKPSGKLSGISGRTSFKWRGIEDPFGNLYEWVDGVLINDNKGYICNKPSLFASTLTADYKPLSYINANANGYPFEMGYDENYPEAQFPIAVGAGSSTGYADYYYQDTGLRGAFFGGHATYGAAAGLFYWNLSYSPSYTVWPLGGRLMYKPPAN